MFRSFVDICRTTKVGFVNQVAYTTYSTTYTAGETIYTNLNHLTLPPVAGAVRGGV